MSRLLLLGATGLVGGEVLRMALRIDSISCVVAPTRRPLAAHPRLLNPLPDFDALPGEAPWWQADAAILALGTTLRAAGSRAAFRHVDLDLVVACARLARRHGTPTLALVSALGANPASWQGYLRTKGEAEQAVVALGFASLAIVRPALIGGERARRRPLEHFGAHLLQAVEPLVPPRWRVVPAQVIAHALLKAALAPAPGRYMIDSERLQRMRAEAA